MKKTLICLFLTLVLLFSSAMSAFAADVASRASGYIGIGYVSRIEMYVYQNCKQVHNWTLRYSPGADRQLLHITLPEPYRSQYVDFRAVMYLETGSSTRMKTYYNHFYPDSSYKYYTTNYENIPSYTTKKISYDFPCSGKFNAYYGVRIGQPGTSKNIDVYFDGK